MYGAVEVMLVKFARLIEVIYGLGVDVNDALD